MNHKLGICFVCNELPPAPSGGIGWCVLTIARGLAAMGHRIMVVGVYDRDYGWNEPGIEVKPLLIDTGKLLGRFSIPSALRIRRKIVELCREKPIDIVEWPDYQGLFLRNISGTVDVVRNHGTVMSHGLYGLAPRCRRAEFMEVRALRAIPNWIGVSRWFMDEWLRISGAKPRRTTVVYNPVDCDLFSPGYTSERDGKVVLYAGRLWERKGAFALARAASIFLHRLPDARLVYVGKDPDGDGRTRIIREAGQDVAGRVVFRDPSPQAELAGIMRRCAVFAMPSILESFGNVWAEAMASGTPVVGSKLTVGPEVVPDGEAGFLADPHDPEEVAGAVVRLMKDSDLRRRMGERGREIALERYSASVGVPKTLEFYRDCLG